VLIRRTFSDAGHLTDFVNENDIDRDDIQSISAVTPNMFILWYWEPVESIPIGFIPEEE
jgi:hypothetical protein